MGQPPSPSQPPEPRNNTRRFNNNNNNNNNNARASATSYSRRDLEEDMETADYFSDDNSESNNDNNNNGWCCRSSKQVDNDDDGLTPQQRKRKCAVRMMVVYIAVALIIFVGVVLWRMGIIFSSVDQSFASIQTNSAPQKGYDEQGRMLCNGHHLNCFRRANEIMYATMHNAMSSRADGFLAYNHLYPLEDALAAGFRGLTIDSCDCGRVGIQLCHGLCLAGFRRPVPTLEAIVKFMTANPHEVVIIEIQVGEESLGPLFTELQEVEGLSDLVYQHPSYTNSSQEGEEAELPWPKLSEMIELNQRLILFAHDDIACEEGSCPAGVHNTYDFSFETPFEQKGLEELMRVDLTCSVSRGWSNSDFVVSNHFATDARGLPDIDIAAEVNSASNLQERLDYCQEKFSTLYMNDVINLLVVDFWNVGDTLSVVDAYNQQLPPKTEAPTEMPSVAPTPTPEPSVAPPATTIDNIADTLVSLVPTSLAPILVSTAVPTKVPAQVSTASPTTSATTAATAAATSATTSTPITAMTTSIPTYSSVSSVLDSILTTEEETEEVAATVVPTSSDSVLPGSLLPLLDESNTAATTASPTDTINVINTGEGSSSVLELAEEAPEGGDEDSTLSNSDNDHSFAMPEKESPAP